MPNLKTTTTRTSIAPFAFAPQKTFAVGKNPNFISVIDVNGDGKVDVVTANTFSSNVSVLLGDGKGNFAPQTTFAVGDSPYSVSVTDVNGDSRADVVAANMRSNNVSVLLGNGKGSFAPQATFVVGDHPFSVSTSDVNNDKKIDVVTANFDSSNISVLLGDGSGSFAPQTTFAVSDRPQSISVADVNGDSKADVVTANYDGSNISVLLGDGDGNFNAPTKFSVGGTPEFVSVDDLNGDGKADIISANSNGNISVLLNTTIVTNAISKGNVMISGLFQQNKTLTTSNNLSDADGLGTIIYQWLNNNVAIPGATKNTYTLTQNDVGKSISVKASYVDLKGTTETITAATIAKVKNLNDLPTGLVSIIFGEPKEGRTLTASNSLADVDGLGKISYQWLADGIAINGENGSDYIVAPTEHGKAISVKASYTDALGTKESVTSKQTNLVTNYAPTGEITIIGDAKVGSVLSIENTLTDADGLPTDSRDFSVQWVQPWFEESNKPRTDYYMTDYIYNATEDTYTITESNMTHAIAVRVTYLDGAGTNEVVVSQPTAKVTAASSEPTYGNDKLIGTAGNDVLSALAGNDTLIGGVGADVLTGGLGADIFVLNGITDSGITSANRDIITDFNSYAGDKIDLSSIHITVELDSYSYQYGWYKNVPLNFIGNDAFSKIDATGQLRFDAATHTLYGSTNADIKPEFSIQLNGVNSLVATDFVL